MTDSIIASIQCPYCAKTQKIHVLVEPEKFILFCDDTAKGCGRYYAVFAELVPKIITKRIEN